MLLIKNVDIYAPEHIGKKDILICAGQIEWIADRIGNLPGPCRILDGDGMCLTPGLIDQHVHVAGGGGEGSFHTRTPEVCLSELIRGGVTTVLGLLGTDGMTRSVENLYAKTAALNEEGITAYMLTGAYGNPGPTITGEPDRDMVFVREILGLKLAISDHRAPHVSVQELIQLASKVRVAGMLSGKPGMLVLHMGDGPECLTPVLEALRNSQVPVPVFRPTHINRNPALLEAGWKFLEMGGYVDLTCGMRGQPSPGECIYEALKRGLPTERLTVSSDGQGSWSEYAEDGTLLRIGVSGVDSLLKELAFMVRDLGFGLEEALPYMTSHVAEAMGIGDVKGYVREGYDGDLLLLTPRMELEGVIARGKIMMEQGELKHWGTYEKTGGKKDVS